MSKKPEDEVQNVTLPQSPLEYSYNGTETVTMSAASFMILWQANEAAIEASIERKFLSVAEWVEVATGKIALTPTREDAESGIIRQVTSIDKTFDVTDPRNFQESFKAWVYPHVINAKSELADIHKVMIETGVASKISDLQAAAQAAQAAQAAAQEAASQEKPQDSKPEVPPLQIVKDEPKTEQTDGNGEDPAKPRAKRKYTKKTKPTKK